MRKVFSLAVLMTLVGFFAVAGDEEKNGPKLTFEPSSHNYGTVYVDEMPNTNLDIRFSNTGNEPLVISNVRACCGTRVTSWPREPIMPGQADTISVDFRLAQRPQRISRTVTVTYNNPEEPTIRYRITGQIVERE